MTRISFDLRLVPILPLLLFAMPLQAKDKPGDVTLIVLNVDEADRGGGLLSLGTEIQWNDREGRVDMTNISTQPIKLGDVRPVG